MSPTACSRIWIYGGLVLLLGGLIFQLVYLHMFAHRPFPVLLAPAETLFTHLARGQTEAAKKTLREAQQAHYWHVRLFDALTHLLKLSGLLILFGVVILSVPERHATTGWICGSLIAGSVLFPLALIGELVTKSVWMQGLAGTGGLIIILGTAGLVWSLIAAPSDRTDIPDSPPR